MSIELEEKEHKVTELEDTLVAKQKEIKQLSNNLQEVVSITASCIVVCRWCPMH